MSLNNVTLLNVFNRLNVFVLYILSYCLQFFKLSIPSENVEFHIYWLCMNIELVLVGFTPFIIALENG